MITTQNTSGLRFDDVVAAARAQAAEYRRMNDINVLANGGGLSRSKDYGSKKKPYPSVSSDDFAGGGRSYPIPTKADAVDALRLAGLHHRADVKAKVYKKYPSLKHPDGGPLNQKPPYSGKWINDKLPNPFYNEQTNKYLSYSNFKNNYSNQPILIDQLPVTIAPDNPNVDLDLMWKNNQSIGNNRKMNMENMAVVDKYLISKKVPLYQRQAILYTILQESGADALDAHENGYYGLVGWSADRYNAIKDKSLLGQAEYLYDTLYNGNGTVDWNHGGTGSGYNSWKDARKAFVDAQDFDTAMRALTYGYVRPAADVKAYRLQNGSKHF